MHIPIRHIPIGLIVLISDTYRNSGEKKITLYSPYIHFFEVTISCITLTGWHLLAINTESTESSLISWIQNKETKGPGIPLRYLSSNVGNVHSYKNLAYFSKSKDFFFSNDSFRQADIGLRHICLELLIYDSCLLWTWRA